MEVNDQRRGRRKDLASHQNGGVSTSNSEDELDPWTAWAYKPRTITLLLIGACFLVWASGVLDPESSSEGDSIMSVKRGLWAMIAVYLAYSLLQAPSTVLIRPHPAIWRLVHGMAVIYLVALTFLLFQRRYDARQFMKFLHPDLGVELPERSYGADCRIYVPENPTSRFKNVYDTLFDEFVLAHILGWWGKAIMIRNQPLLWLLSIVFELMELTFRHMLPNFNECWWDSIILDILICNWFGTDLSSFSLSSHIFACNLALRDCCSYVLKGMHLAILRHFIFPHFHLLQIVQKINVFTVAATYCILVFGGRLLKLLCNSLTQASINFHHILIQTQIFLYVSLWSTISRNIVFQVFGLECVQFAILMVKPMSGLV